jgi:hypothetical protein
MISIVFVSNKKLFHKILIRKPLMINISIRDLVSLVIYDDGCYLCSKFASIVHTFAKDKILIVGHYSDLGMKIKSEIFKQNYDSAIMFWRITKKIVYMWKSGNSTSSSKYYNEQVKNKTRVYTIF